MNSSRKKTIIFFFLFLQLHSFAQKKERFYDYEWKECMPALAKYYSMATNTDSGCVRADYFIHGASLQMIGKYTDTSCKIRNGYFQYFYTNGQLEHSGKYEDGKRQGLWLSFHYNGMMSDSAWYTNGNRIGTSLRWHANGFMADSIVKQEGKYLKISWFDNGNSSSAGHFIDKEDSLTGQWIFFHKNGIKSAVEEYDGFGKVKSKTCFDESGSKLNNAEAPDEEAKFGNKKKAWQSYLSKNTYFPDNFRISNSDLVVVVVNFSINEDGSVSDAFVSLPFHSEFDQIALKAVLNAPKWQPAISHNRKVKSFFRQPVTFVQNE